MLVFSTKIPLRQETTCAQWVSLFKEWVVNSKHYPFCESDFVGFDCNALEPIKISKEPFTFAITYYEDETVTLAACKLETITQGETWITQNVAYEEDGRKYLLVQTHCIKKEYIGSLPSPKTPYTVKLFIRNGMCAPDGVFPITDKPIEMCEQYIDGCAQAMQGSGEGVMPIVYISHHYWPSEIDTKALARNLQGIAHVIVEPDFETSQILREASHDNNVYGGYIGVYFPGYSYRRKFADSFYPEGTAKYKLANDIVATIRNALLNKADATKYSWDRIKSLQHRQKASKLQLDTASLEELQEWYDTFEKENERLTAKLKDCERTNVKLYEEIDRLNAILECYKTSTNAEKTALLQLGSESDLYPGEHNDILIDILAASLRNLDPNTRPYHIVQSILQANKRKGIGDTIEQTIKQVFKGKGDIRSSSAKRSLSNIGFTITQGEKNHYSLTFCNDNRYNFTTASSPSDYTGGNNMVSDICKRLFVRTK